MPNLGTTELLLILGIVILLFGASRLPAIGRGMGQSIRGFRKAMEDDSSPKPDLVLNPVKEEVKD